MSHVVLRIKVERLVKGAALFGSGPTPYVYLALGRGAELVDDEGRQRRAGSSPSVDDLKAAIPPGTDVIAFTGLHVWRTDRDSRYEQTTAGRPADTPLLGGYFRCDGHLNFDLGERALAGWPDLRFRDLAAAIE